MTPRTCLTRIDWLAFGLLVFRMDDYLGRRARLPQSLRITRKTSLNWMTIAQTLFELRVAPYLEIVLESKTIPEPSRKQFMASLPSRALTPDDGARPSVNNL